MHLRNKRLSGLVGNRDADDAHQDDDDGLDVHKTLIEDNADGQVGYASDGAKGVVLIPGEIIDNSGRTTHFIQDTSDGETYPNFVNNNNNLGEREEKSLFSCSQCSAVFPNSKQLVTHLSVHKKVIYLSTCQS